MNTYAAIAAENGFISLAAFLSAIFIALRNFIKLEKKHDIFLYLKCSFLLWLFVAMTLDSYGTVLFWSLMGASFLGIYILKQSDDSQNPN